MKRNISIALVLIAIAAAAVFIVMNKKDSTDKDSETEDETSDLYYEDGTELVLKAQRDTTRRAFLNDLALELETFYSENGKYPKVQITSSGFLLEDEQSNAANENFSENGYLVPGNATTTESTKYCVIQEDGKYTIGMIEERGEEFFMGDLALEEKCVLGLDTSDTTNSNINTNSMSESEKVGRHAVLSESEINSKKSVITTTKGVIEIEFFDYAPLAVSNHIGLTNEGFYNGLTFHRREEGFVIQGGDPDGNGTGGPGYSFEDEYIPDTTYARTETPYGEVIMYERGLVAMANAGPDTNGSQFFIMLDDVQLPPSYTIFGKVISGLEVVDQIKVGDKMTKVEIVNK